jgi:glycosyltransferase involved in cell wall biosynthesis
VVPSICLCMIVRDEAEVIERCLASTKGLIDSWVICDTGSRDGTQSLVESLLEDVPGRLYEHQWRNFGHNRSELMHAAAGQAEYLLLLDADMTVTFDRAGLSSLSADSYLLRHDEPVEYWIKRLVKGDREWGYVGSTHEYLARSAPEVVEKLDAIVIHHHADSGTRPEKLGRDLRLLKQDLRTDPSDARAVFYLAQTYRDLGRRTEAIELYERRTAMGGWDQEVFYSLFQAGVLRAESGEWPAARAALVEAWEYRPVRLEPVYELASRSRVRGDYRSAYLFARRGLGQPPPDDILFVWPWVYRWGLLFEYSIAAYWVGEREEALAACRRLLSLSDLPEEYRKATATNMGFCLQRTPSKRRRENPSREGPVASGARSNTGPRPARKRSHPARGGGDGSSEARWGL